MPFLPMKAGQVVAGKYRLDARLGIGGMGEVWKAIHEGTDREFALKFMHPHVSTSSTARQRFTREARVSAKINHPNVIDIFDVGEFEDGILFLAMELLDGVSLADALHASQPLSVQEFLTVVLDSARALSAAHAAGVVHRDLKPANIYLHRDRGTGFASAKILDFGISKLGGESEHTKTGAVLGSPRYMSPEQTRSAASVDHRSDLWSMGVILFEGLTGTWPHEGDSFSSLVVAICTVPPTSIDLMVPSLPEALRSIVRDCLQPLNQRLTTASELATRLAGVLADPSLQHIPLPRPLHPPSDSIRTVTSVRVHPPLLTTGDGRISVVAPAPDSLRTTKPREASASARADAQAYDDDATHIRTPAPRAQSQVGETPHPPAQPVSMREPPRAPTQTVAMAELPQPAEAPQVSMASAPAAPRGPVFKPMLKTIPLSASGSLHAELQRAGVFGPPPAPTLTQPLPPTPVQQTPQQTPYPPDPLLGTVSRNNFETRPSIVPEPPTSPPQPTPFAMAPAPTLLSPPRAAGGKGLGVIAAVLAVVLVGIVVALVSVLRSGPHSAAADANDPAPSASARAATAPPTAVEAKTAAPIVTASAAPVEPAPSTAPTASASAAPDKPRPAGRPSGPGPKGPSKVKQLGSGL